MVTTYWYYSRFYHLMILWKLLRWLPGYYFKVVKTTACADFYHLLQLVVVHVIVPLSGKPIHSKNEVWV